jgi:Raf kinase inhibitor-like YbhB/YbcL family protein
MGRKLLDVAAAFLILVMLVRFGGMAQAENKAGAMKLSVSSPGFAQGDRIPVKYTCDGEGVSPPVYWSKGPAATQSYALIADDPDAPRGTFTHWVMYNIPSGVTRLEEHVTAVDRLDDGTIQGKNSNDKVGYAGPCPPPGKPHRYRFNLYALDSLLDLGPGASKADLLNAMNGHVLAQGELMGTYGR